MTNQPSTGGGLDPKLAALLCYLCMPWTGLIFVLIEKNNKDIKLHAWHGLVIGGFSFVFFFVLSLFSMILGNISIWLAGMFGIVQMLASLGFFVLWIVLMIKAYQGEILNLPVLTDIAKKQAEK